MLDDESSWPSAVVAGNDLIALGVLRALRARGLRCPDDLSVIGFNDMVFAEDLHPPLTTVRVPARRMGEEAARLLLEMIETGAPTDRLVSLPVELVANRRHRRPAGVTPSRVEPSLSLNTHCAPARRSPLCPAPALTAPRWAKRLSCVLFRPLSGALGGERLVGEKP
jgi:hypothetical protein